MKTTLRRLPSGHAMDIAAIRTIGIDGNGCAHAVGEGLAAYYTDQADIDAVRTFIASMPPLTPEVPLAPPAVDAGSDIERVRDALAVARANLGYEKQRADAAEAKLASCESLLRAERERDGLHGMYLASLTRAESAEAERDDMRTARNIAEARAKDAEAKLADANRLRSEAVSTFKAREDAIERAEKRAATAEMERDARADDAKLGAAVRAVLDMFMWDHSTVRAEVESDRLAETVEGCIFVAIERAIRPADFVPAHAKASGGER